MNEQQSSSPHHDDDDESIEKPPAKRSRVSLACQRCKHRKQKCDGDHPSCSSCVRIGSECHYVLSTAPKAAEQKLYVKALEERVAELESNLSYSGRSGVADDHWERLQPQEEAVDSLSTAISDLTLSASGYYVGGTSNLTLGRLLGPVVHKTPTLLEANEEEPSRIESISTFSPEPVESPKLPDTLGFSGAIAETLFEAYIKYTSTQYPVIHSRQLRDIHSRRHSLNDVYEISILHLVYANGGRALEMAGKNGHYSSDEHYEAAMQNRDVVIQYIDRRSIIYLALATMYCLRAPREPGPWTMIGLAIKLCISIGLHRKSVPVRFSVRAELDRRLFWTCYILDRDQSLTCGRPPSISDHDIDAPLPLDVEEGSISLVEFRKAVGQDPNIPSNPPTSLTFFLCTLRMARIKSRIQHSIYRVDRNVNASCDIIDGFLNQLARWRELAPSPRLSPEMTLPPNSTCSYETLHLKDSYMIQYYAAVRLLLFPQLTESVVNMHYLKLCAAACQGMCESYKRLHQKSMAFCYSPIATQSLFLAGLTLVYCIWHAPAETLTGRAIDALTDCLIMLYVMTERWPTAQKYRNVFERVKTSVLDLVSNRKHVFSTAVAIVDEETRTALDGIDSEFGSGLGMMNVSHMINDITGESAPVWEDDDFAFDSLQNLRQTPQDDISGQYFGDPNMSKFLNSENVNGFEHMELNGVSRKVRGDFLDWSSAATHM